MGHVFVEQAGGVEPQQLSGYRTGYAGLLGMIQGWNPRQEMLQVSEFRVRKCNEARPNPQGDFVIYWMIASRRTQWNYGLQRSVEWALNLGKPLVVLEALRCGYRWASDRIHRFIMEGMRDNARKLSASEAFYYPYLEPEKDAGKGLLKALSAHACCVVTDDFPCFFLPRMVGAAARQVNVLLEAVDSNGILPIRWSDRVFATAFSFRRFLQKNLEPVIQAFPERDPVHEVEVPKLRGLPLDITDRWPPAHGRISEITTEYLKAFPIDHTVKSSHIRGGPKAATERLGEFLDSYLKDYAGSRNHPDMDCTSGLSPYLHFGHISVYQVFTELMDREDWSVTMLAAKATGKRSGWWRVGESAEAFLDQLITWREIGYNMCTHRSDYHQYESLPDWARQTLEAHESDPRPYRYSLERLELADTHDEIWNAAQRQLVREGRLHTYLRMLWGKKILEWSPSAQVALERMVELNNKYALDGRNPNSYSGILWVLGRYDRAWGPQRPIFGKVRYMSSESARRKLKLSRFLERYGP
ncbi:deoxyribodipyrimidine photolyase [Thermodesulfobacteriota bacterium]